MSKNNLPSLDIVLDTKLYPLEAIYAASSVFLDKAYLFLDGNPATQVKVTLTLKDASFFPRGLAQLKKEFLNEILNYSLRYLIAQKNKNLRDFILSTALLGSLGELNPSEDFFHNEEFLAEELQETELEKKEETPSVVFEDPEGIAIPWEEKFQPLQKKIKKQKK